MQPCHWILLASLLQLDTAALNKTGQAEGVAINILMNKDGNLQPVPMDTVFRNNDLIRVKIQTNFDGYVYILNSTPNSVVTLLYPTPESGAGNRVRRGETIEVPGSGWFKFTGEPGTEGLYVIMSPTPLVDVEREFSGRIASSQPRPQSQAGMEDTKPGRAEQKSAPSKAADPTAAQTAEKPQTATTGSVSTGASASKTSSATATAKKAQASGIAKVEKSAPMTNVKSGVGLFNDVGRLPSSVMGTLKSFKSRDLNFANDEMNKTAYISMAGNKLAYPVIFQLDLVHR